MGENNNSKFKLNIFLACSVIIFVLLPPTKFLYKRTVIEVISERPYYKEYVSKSTILHIVFPTVAKNDLTLNDTRLDCADIDYIFNEISKEDTITAYYTRYYFFGLVGKRILIQMEHDGNKIINDVCVANKNRTYYTILGIVFLFGFLKACYPYFKSSNLRKSKSN